MEKAPKITVVMNCAYGVKYVREAIDSIFAQTFQDWQILFVDNISEDGCAEIANSYLPTGKLKYVKTSHRIPIYQARNFALDHIDGDYVCFLDVDDRYAPDMLERLYARMAPSVSFVYGGWQFINASGAPKNRHIQGRAQRSFVNALLLKSFVAVSCILLHRNVLNANRFDHSFELMGDYELWIRLGATGHKCDYVVGCLTDIRIHGQNISILKAEQWILEERRFYRAFLKRYGFLRYPAILGYILKYEIGHLVGRRRL